MQPGVHLPKRLPLTRVRLGTRWMRIHARSRNALWFGPAVGSSPVHRFDDPLGRFRVCYLGTAIDVCFAETFLRNPPVRILGLADLADRLIATIRVQRELRLVPLHGPSLARLGSTAELATSGDYSPSQAWSRALWEHTDMESRSRQSNRCNRFPGPLPHSGPEGARFLTGMDVSPDGRWLLYSQLDRVESEIMLIENFR